MLICQNAIMQYLALAEARYEAIGIREARSLSALDKMLNPQRLTTCLQPLQNLNSLFR